MLRFYIIMILIISSNEYSNCLKKITEIDPFKIFGIDTKWIFEDIKKKYFSELLDFSELLTKVKDDKNPTEGIESILKQLHNVFEREHITSIESIGKPFDHQYHHAVSTIEKNDCADGLIVEEIKKGYLLNGKIMRPSQVVVAKNKKIMEE